MFSLVRSLEVFKGTSNGFCFLSGALLWVGVIGAPSRISLKTKAVKAVQQLKLSIEIYEKVEKAYKELGIDIPSELKKQTPVPALQEAEKDLSMLTSLFSKFKVR